MEILHRLRCENGRWNMKYLIIGLRISVILLWFIYIAAWIKGSDIADNTLLAATWLLACSNLIELNERNNWK